MREYVFAEKMTEEAARRIAVRKGDWFWNIVFGGLPLAELRLMYLEFLLITLSVGYQPGVLEKFRRRAVGQAPDRHIEVIADGTTGKVAVVSSCPEILVRDLQDEHVQRTDFDEESLIDNARKLAVKVSHRFLGGIPLVEVKEFRSVFRPYWVAFYGEMREGSKVRYLPIAADGGKSKRVR